MDKLIGKEFGQYRIEAKVGEGGMAAVFKAYQASLDRYVAVKVLPPHFAARDPIFIKRFRREAQAVARLNHPNILPVYDFGVEQHYSYIVMRYVESVQTLDQIIALSPRSEHSLYLVGQVASALTYAHQRGLVHRDVKPNNILIDNSNWALLSDFGVVKVIEAVTSQLTDTGQSFGTAAYMAPEQARGQPVIDHRVDIYALGVIVYEMLTGTIPHNAPTSLAILFQRATEPPIPPRDLNPEISITAEQVVLRALAVEPSDRFDTAVDFFQALQHGLSGRSRATLSLPGMASSASPDHFPFKNRNLGELIGTYRNYPTNSSSPPCAPEGYKFLQFLQVPKIFITGGVPLVILLAIIGGCLAALSLLFWNSGGGGPTPGQTGETGVTVMAAIDPTTRLPTPSPTSRPTDTPAPPTSTSTPTPTATLAPPTATPTRTPLPPSATPTVIPAHSTALPTATPTITTAPTLALPDNLPILLKPVSLDEPSYGLTQFEWEWAGDLPPGFGFEIRVWREGEPPAGAHDAVLDNQQGRIEKIGENRYRLTLDIRQAAGVRGRAGLYLWTVALVQISPAYLDLDRTAEPSLFRFEAGGDDKGGDEGGEGGIS